MMKPEDDSVPEYKISILNILETLALKEAELIWQRFSMMLYANTGLFGIVTVMYQQKALSLIIGTSLLGATICMVWMKMISLSSFYYERWQRDADALIDSDPKLREFIRGRLNPRIYIEGKPEMKIPKRHASFYSLVVPISFFACWILLLIITIFFGLPNVAQ